MTTDIAHLARMCVIRLELARDALAAVPVTDDDSSAPPPPLRLSVQEMRRNMQKAGCTYREIESYIEGRG